MVIANTLIGKTVSLRTCVEEDAREEYVNWLNDSHINQFMDVRRKKQTIETVTDYIREMQAAEDEVLFAIIDSLHNKHIGGIHLNINRFHKYCNFGYFIGDKNFWGREIAVEAIQLAIKWVFESTDVVRMNATLYAHNIFSYKILLKVGFQKEAVIKNYLTWKDDRRDDWVWMSLFRDEFEKMF